MLLRVKDGELRTDALEAAMADLPPLVPYCFPGAAPAVVGRTLRPASPPKPSEKEENKTESALASVEAFPLNAYLPEWLQFPPIIWLMLLFGILTHFVIQSTMPQKRRRPGKAGRGGLGGMGGMGGLGGMGGMPNFEEMMANMNSGGGLEGMGG